jgi:hypothetical protein
MRTSDHESGDVKPSVPTQRTAISTRGEFWSSAIPLQDALPMTFV